MSTILDEKDDIEHGEKCSAHAKSEICSESKVFFDWTADTHASEETDGEEAVQEGQPLGPVLRGRDV